MKYASISLAIALASAAAAVLCGCTQTGDLSPSVQASITKAYNQVCPAVSSGALDPLADKFNANVQNAYAAARTICANGAPTNIVVAGLDILAVEPLLEPYLAKVKIKA